MNLVQDVSFEKAKENVREAAMDISIPSERNAMIIALMQLQGAVERDMTWKEEMDNYKETVSGRQLTVCKRERGEVTESRVVQSESLEEYVMTKYRIKVNANAAVEHVDTHGLYVCEGKYFDIEIT